MHWIVECVLLVQIELWTKYLLFCIFFYSLPVPKTVFPIFTINNRLSCNWTFNFEGEIQFLTETLLSHLFFFGFWWILVEHCVGSYFVCRLFGGLVGLVGCQLSSWSYTQTLSFIALMLGLSLEETIVGKLNHFFFRLILKPSACSPSPPILSLSPTFWKQLNTFIFFKKVVPLVWVTINIIDGFVTYFSASTHRWTKVLFFSSSSFSSIPSPFYAFLNLGFGNSVFHLEKCFFFANVVHGLCVPSVIYIFTSHLIWTAFFWLMQN